MNITQARLIEEIMESQNERDLTNWERQFVDDLFNRDEDYILTDHQNKKLIEVHAGVCWL